MSHSYNHWRLALGHRHRGMDRLVQYNVLGHERGAPLKPRATVNTLLLDKTGTITAR
ncbi:MAG: hypothetical protein WDM87_12665 [Terracidiphilus sp.]